MGTVPLQDIDRAVQELERITQDLGLRAVEVSSNVNGVDYDDPRFAPFFAKAEELGVSDLMISSGLSMAGRSSAYY